MGEEKLQALLQESLAVATRTNAMKPSDLARVVIDTTVQPKAVMFPTDAKLLNRARERLVRLAKKLGVSLRQSYRPVGKLADQAPALRPCPSVQARQPELTQAQDLSWPRHPRHRAAHRWVRRFAGAVRAAAVPGPTGAGTRPAPARSPGLFPCTRQRPIASAVASRIDL